MPITPPLHLIFVILILTASLHAGSDHPFSGPAITFSQPDTHSVSSGSVTMLITISDTAGIAAYALSLNGIDRTSKAKLESDVQNRQSLRLSYKASLIDGLNTILVTATNNENRSSSKYLSIRKDKSPSNSTLSILRKALYHLAKRLF